MIESYPNRRAATKREEDNGVFVPLIALSPLVVTLIVEEVI